MTRHLLKLGSLTVCLFLSAYFIGLACADQFAPTWLKEGTYAKYTTDQVGYAYLANNSRLQGNDTLSFWNATFGWRCITINNTVAKIEFTLDYIGKTLNDVSLDNATLHRSGEVYVDQNTRTVKDLNGSLLGTTHMWLPANPTEGQDIVVWDIPSDKEVLPAKVNDVWFQTIQGKQDGFMVDGTVTINGNPTNFVLLCDLNTGLMVDGNFEWDPIITGAGINALLLNGRIILSDTNISLGPTYNPPNWSIIIAFATLPILSFVVLFVVFYKRMHKKR